MPDDVICTFLKDATYCGHVLIFSELFAKESYNPHLLSSYLFQQFVTPQPISLEWEPMLALLNCIKSEMGDAQQQHSCQMTLNSLANIVLLGERNSKAPSANLDSTKERLLITNYKKLMNEHYTQQSTVQFYC